MSDKEHPQDGNHHPHLVPLQLLIAVILALFALTFITVAASWVDLGSMNVPVALLIASIKGTLVAAFFMHLRWDKPFNSIILALSIGFLILFLGITGIDTSENNPTIDESYSEEYMERQRATLAAKLREETGATGSDLDVLYPGSHGTEHKTSAADPRADALQKWALMIFTGPLPTKIPDPAGNISTPAKVSLGKSLYFEPRLSKSGKISCNSCHLLDKFGVDGLPTSPGHEGQLGARNSPTVFNAGFHTSQFWDGREPDLEGQAKGPILNPVEMAMTDPASVVATVKGIPGYVKAFGEAFPGEPEPITYDNLARAIAAFERTLVTPSPFDAFLGGKLEALTKEQLDGLEAFKAQSCQTCHKGLALGGDSFKKLGEVVAYATKDIGREGVTKQAADRHLFKVPSLRNVAKTGPYFHDGSITDLSVAVKLMAKHQLGNTLTDEQAAKIVAFLESLTGTPDPATIAAPPPVQ